MQISHGNVNWLSLNCQLSVTSLVLVSTKCQCYSMARQYVSKATPLANASPLLSCSVRTPACPLYRNHSAPQPQRADKHCGNTHLAIP